MDVLRLRRIARLAWATGVILLVTACAAPERRVAGYLDEQTAVTVTSVAEPLVFARGRSDLASHARDYATLAAVSVNRSGEYEHLLLVYLWSTVDPRLADAAGKGEQLLLFADDRAIRLIRDERDARAAGISRRLHAPAGSRAPARVYRIDPAALAYIARSARLRLQVDDDAGHLFELWKDGRAALSALAGRAPQ